MQEFVTHGVRHDFSVDGKAFYMPGVTVADIERAAELDDMQVNDRIIAFRDLMTTRARPSTPTFFGKSKAKKAVSSLSITQLSQLFAAWVTMDVTVTPGESLGSADSQ